MGKGWAIILPGWRKDQHSEPGTALHLPKAKTQEAESRHQSLPSRVERNPDCSGVQAGAMWGLTRLEHGTVSQCDMEFTFYPHCP